ncbi:hypothetical protein CHS0354_007446 [Potamilus streckersoni]|uniref:Uncharacterized protein n=1 Tax=Potamilus streckersoni TaxID=2493646 RepID=A0AAE0SW98_9BIVA|nr:hypothetical protein CHS0354_007446 [Potamilus streckersoni]
MAFEDTYCSKGKILINGSCDYPTESPGAISRYGVYYSVTLSYVRMETPSAVNQSSSSVSQVHNVTSTFFLELHKVVLENLNKSWTSLNASIQTELFESWSKLSCMDPIPVSLSYMHEISMLIYSELLVTSLRIKKRTFETILLENKTFQFLFDQKRFDMNVTQDFSLFFLHNSNKGIFDQGCFQRDEMPYSLGIENPVIISDLLVCTHKELRDGFTMNAQNSSVYIPILLAQLFIIYYRLIFNLSAMVTMNVLSLTS